MISVSEYEEAVEEGIELERAWPDGVQGFWLKYFRAFHVRIAEQLKPILEAGPVPYWMN